MPNGVIAIASAVGAMDDSTMDAQNAKALEIITIIGGTAELSSSWSQQWNIDSRQYFIDSLSVTTDPKYTALAAADYSKYQIDLQQGQTEMGSQTSQLQDNKGVLRALGNAMDQVYSISEGVIQAAKALTKVLLMLGS